MNMILLTSTVLVAGISAFLYFRHSRSIEHSQIVVEQACKNIAKSINIMNVDCDKACAAINNLLADPHTNYDASIWAPRAMAIRKLSTSAQELIDRLKIKVKGDRDHWSIYESGEAQRLYESLTKYKAAVLEQFAPDTSKMSKIVAVDLNHIKGEFEKRELSMLSTIRSRDWSTYNFANASTNETLLGLTEIESEVARLELYSTEFLLKQIPDRRGDVFYTMHVMTGVNSNILRSGQRLEVYVHLSGLDYYGIKPKVRVNGEYQNLSENWESTYIQKVTQPGEHTVKVEVQFSKPDGVLESMWKSLEYEVVQ